MSNYIPLHCPHCGNASTNGISHCYIEWNVTPVMGVLDDAIVVDARKQVRSSISPEVVTTMTDTPNQTPDLSHLYCHKCGWCWVDERDMIDVYSVENVCPL